MIKLYDNPLSGNCYKVRLLLNHLGLEYRKEQIDIFRGEHKSDEFARLNPNMKIPVLDDNGFIIWESNAILLYLAKKFSPNPYISDEPTVFGNIVQWMFFGKTMVDPNFAVARYYKKFMADDQYDINELNKLQENCYRVLEQLNKHFAISDYLSGNYSIADMACYPYIKLSYQADIEIDNYPEVSRWMESVENQSGYISFKD